MILQLAAGWGFGKTFWGNEDGDGEMQHTHTRRSALFLFFVVRQIKIKKSALRCFRIKKGSI